MRTVLPKSGFPTQCKTIRKGKGYVATMARQQCIYMSGLKKTRPGPKPIKGTNMPKPYRKMLYKTKLVNIFTETVKFRYILRKNFGNFLSTCATCREKRGSRSLKSHENCK